MGAADRRTTDSDRRRKPRVVRAKTTTVRVVYQIRPGAVVEVPARLLDIQDDGCGVESSVEFAPGVAVLLSGDLLDCGKDVRAGGRIAWIRPVGPGIFRAGVQFAEPLKSSNQSKPIAPAVPVDSDDLYEILQLSSNADVDTIHRVYRLMAQRYHPDNQETGDSVMFRRILEAYRTLSDPEKRAAYDAQHSQVKRLRWKIFDQPSSAQGVHAERSKRHGILGLLYAKRVNAPEAPGMNIMEMEDLLGVPREHLEFSLWYLKENGLIQKTDNGRYSITVKGVDKSEEISPVPLRAERLIEAQPAQ